MLENVDSQRRPSNMCTNYTIQPHFSLEISEFNIFYWIDLWKSYADVVNGTKLEIQRHENEYKINFRSDLKRRTSTFLVVVP